ncbi:hypothetical protein ACHQM5_005781 [Ranunculus cassubicifolius]
MAVFGINMGTKNSYLSVLEKGSHTPRLIKKFPSEVVVTDQVDKNDIDPRDCFSGFIRLLGREFDDPIVQREMNKGKNGDAWVETSYGKQCSPSELLQMLALKIKAAAETYLGKISVSNSVFVFTFPSRVLVALEFEMIIMGVRCGFNDVKLVHEFSAAAAIYGLHKRRGLSAIVDFGARTLDITFWISPLDDVFGAYTIKGLPQRGMYLGGDDFDDVILKYIVSEFKIKEGIDLVEDRRLREAAEKAKIALSTSIETKIKLPNVITDPSGDSRDLKIKLTREKFETLAGNLTEKIRQLCVKSLNKASISAKDLKDVLLVGGMANVPMVKRVIEEVFGKAPKRGVDKEAAVACGAVMVVAEASSCLGINPACMDT